MLDLTTQFFDHVASEGARLGWPQDRLLKLGSVSPASLLASVPRNSFVGQALAIGREVTRAMAFLSKNAVDYCRAGRISEAERDRIEEEAGLIIKAATGAIDSLKRQVRECPSLKKVIVSRRTNGTFSLPHSYSMHSLR